MKINMEMLTDIKAHAHKDSPRECCGLIVEVFKDHPSQEKYFLYRCNNSAEDKENNFLIQVPEYVMAEQHGEVIGIYHSHTQNYEEFSEVDKTMSERLELYNLLYILEKDKFILLDPFNHEQKEIKYDPSKTRREPKEISAIVTPQKG